MDLKTFLSSAFVQDCAFVAKSLIGFTMSGRARRPNHNAFIRILQAFGAGSPRAPSPDVNGLVRVVVHV